jgi:hypothetical protein
MCSDIEKNVTCDWYQYFVGIYKINGFLVSIFVLINIVVVVVVKDAFVKKAIIGHHFGIV